MASLKEHCEDCSRELGEDFKHVHEWLDALFKVLGPKHRSARHHTGGVEEVRKMWGDRAARAAEIHICKDYGGSVPSEKDVQLWSLCGPPKIKRNDVRPSVVVGNLESVITPPPPVS